MGKAFLRKDGRWYIQIYIGKNSEGKRIFEHIYGSSQKEVEQKARAVLWDKDHGRYIKPEKITLYEHMTNWIEKYKVIAGIQETTYQLYRMYIEKHFKEADIGRMMIGDIKPMHIESFHSKKLKEGQTINTVKKYNAVLSKAIEYAYKNDMIKNNPMDKVQMPKLHHKYKPNICTISDYKKLLQHSTSSEMTVIMTLAAKVGMRRSEILALEWSDIFDKDKIIRIKGATVKAHNNKNIDKDTKNHESRFVATSDAVIQCISDYKKSLKVVHPRRMFTITPDALTKRFEKIREKAGVNIRFHDLRHFNAAIMDKAKISNGAGAKRLGHKQESTYTDIYKYIFDEVDRTAAELIENVIDMNMT